MKDQLDMWKGAPSHGLASAILSACGTYRYQLHRNFYPGPSRTLMWLMLNPSTADASVDDPTIRKCTGFTRRCGYGRFLVGNLFAYRATDPNDLYAASRVGVDVVGPDNRGHLADMLDASEAVVLAWGTHGDRWVSHVSSVLEIVKDSGKPTLTLGRCKGGSPKHPLMVGYDIGLEHLRGDQLDMFGDTKPKPKPVWVKRPTEWRDVAIEEDPELVKLVRKKLGMGDE